MEIKNLTFEDVRLQIIKKGLLDIVKNKKIYGVPRGGSCVALMLHSATLVNIPEEADIIVDDIIDSGKTRDKYFLLYPHIPFYSLYEKSSAWLHFPWEHNAECDIQDTVIRQLEFLGENAAREGLVETPSRVVRSWEKLYGGYNEKPEEILSKTFTQQYDEVVLLKDIELYSTCEHHMLPFFGKCHIAYLPNDKIVGISKLARLMECFARRLQIQERLVNQIADALQEHLKPKGVAVIVEAQHFCMTSRGVEKQRSKMVTSALRGVFLENSTARKELLDLIKS